ncbi:MAG: hypothetical protein MHM6MM_000017 [Cercozoa sp. M6MM]
MKQKGMRGLCYAFGIVAMTNLVSAVVDLPLKVQMLLVALPTIWIGARDSLKRSSVAKLLGEEACDMHEYGRQQEVIGSDDAKWFPVMASCMLFGVWLVFKYAPPQLIKYVIAAYMCFVGISSVFMAQWSLVRVARAESFLKSKPFLAKTLFQIDLNQHKVLAYVAKQLGVDMKKSVKVLTGADAVFGAVSLFVVVVYTLTKHWMFNNMIAFCLCVQAVGLLRLGSYKAAAMLLAGLFVYDVFWVFGTPVMVDVATKFDGPIKFLFPVTKDGARAYSLLGLGDVVMPGIFLALVFRFDVMQRGAAALRGRDRIFQGACVGYVVGLAVTVVAMRVFQHAQPALLYLVPGVLLGSLGGAFATGGLKEVTSLIKYEEAEDVDPADDDDFEYVEPTEADADQTAPEQSPADTKKQQ